MITRARNGKMLKFLTIKTTGFTLTEICDGILLRQDDLDEIKKMTRKKMIETFKQGFLDSGFYGLECAGERITDYDNKIETVKKLVSTQFPNLDD